MKHHLTKTNFNFIVEPQEFNKYSEKDYLQYCLGATLYMPGTKDITKIIFEKRWPELTTMVMCFEDAIDEKDLPAAEENVINTLNKINQALINEEIRFNDLPLFILRVRNVEQFVSFTNQLTKDQIKIITAFNFPKFSSQNGVDFFSHLKTLNERFDEILYGMPILESETIAYVETRIDELKGVKQILDNFGNLVLNIRVGATDFSSYFGLRRGIDFGIYDIMNVRDALSDVLNFFSRANNEYVISAPVWEYFSMNKEMKFDKIIPHHLTTSLLTRETIVDEAVDGLLREIIIDKANGFFGKTVIHPTHVKYVNAMHAVTKEEYDDACQILQTSGGVVKSSKANKMNEINPHRSWAKKTFARAKAFGVIESSSRYFDLFSEL